MSFVTATFVYISFASILDLVNGLFETKTKKANDNGSDISCSQLLKSLWYFYQVYTRQVK